MVETGRDRGLPRSVEVLWDKARRGPREGLSVDRVVAAAIAFADEEGLPSLSMARVANRLGSATMSLYRHVSSKDELRMLMVDVAYGKPPSVPENGALWRAGLEKWARALLDVFGEHSWMVEIPVSGPPLEPGQLAWLEAGLAALVGTGLRPDEKLSVIVVLIGHVRATAQLFAAVDADVAYGDVLAALVDASAFPALSELVEARVFDSPTDDFGFGLRRILDGVEALIHARS